MVKYYTVFECRLRNINYDFLLVNVELIFTKLFYIKYPHNIYLLF